MRPTAIPEITDPGQIDELWASLNQPADWVFRKQAKRRAKRAAKAIRRKAKKYPKWIARQRRRPVTLALLESLFEYADGVFYWREDRGGRHSIKAGDVAGHMAPGGWRIRLQGRVYMRKRLAALWLTGEWPARKRRASGYGTGVTRNNLKPARPWAARLKIDGLVRYLGVHETEEAALAAVAAARVALLSEATP